MNSIFSEIQAFLPKSLDLKTIFLFLGLCCAGALIIGLFNRLVLGKRSSVNHAVSSAMGILLIYVLTVCIYTLKPWQLDRYLSPLPFVAFSADRLAIFPFSDATFQQFSQHFLSILILSFMVNLLDSFIPKGNSLPGWFGYRFLTVLMSMILHFLFGWLANAYLPGVLVTYAPAILLVILVVLLLLCLGKLVLGIVLTAVNPILGGIYAFFFSNSVGKQITKSVLTAGIITGFFWAADHFGYTLIGISISALATYLPMVLVFLALWYLLGHVL